MVSSEFFAWAKPADIVRRIVDDVGLDRVHVVVTLRPLAKDLPSMWQQNIQAGHVYRSTSGSSGSSTATPSHRLLAPPPPRRADRPVGAAVGVDRVTAIVVDDRDHGFLPRTFERLLGLREGTLAVVDDYTNRSLTVPEVEAVRAFNVAYADQACAAALHARMMRFGAAQTHETPPPPADEPRVELPRVGGRPGRRRSPQRSSRASRRPASGSSATSGR